MFSPICERQCIGIIESVVEFLFLGREDTAWMDGILLFVAVACMGCGPILFLEEPRRRISCLQLGRPSSQSDQIFLS